MLRGLLHGKKNLWSLCNRIVRLSWKISCLIRRIVKKEIDWLMIRLIKVATLILTP